MVQNLVQELVLNQNGRSSSGPGTPECRNLCPAYRPINGVPSYFNWCNYRPCPI